ncbi:MAG: hypothetical protein J5990_11325 [Bacteroidales bacterium]|nr:hypothetical protein [Bacteroidales bacterium]
MAKQNNSLTELQALEGIYEHLSTIDNLSEEVGKMSTRLSKIEQAHNTTLTTVTSFTKSMTQSFEEMKSLKSKEVPVSLCKTEALKTIVREQMTMTLKGIDLKAEVSPEYYERMDKLIKRPPLLSLHLNLTAKVFAIIMALLFVLGIAGYVRFINTPMYLGHELYISYVNRRHPSPGQGFHKAYQATLSGNRKGVKALIRNSNYWEKDYRTYADTLRNILSDSTIFINGIQYGQYERLVDYTDSTDTIKSAHFRKDGSIRITDDQRMITLEDARNTKIKWKRVR